MPALTGPLHQNIMGVLQHSLDGSTSMLVPSGQAFYDPAAAASTELDLKYAGLVLKRGTLSVVSIASGAIITLESSEQVAQFRVGDACFLVGNSFAGVVGAANNTADAVTVDRVSAVNQTVTVTGRAGGEYAVGSSLVMVAAAQPGGYSGGSSDGPTVDSQRLAALLDALQTSCNSTGTLAGGAHTTTRVDVDNPAPPNDFDEEGAIIGATITFLTGTALNIGCTAKVASVTVADPTILNLEDIKDANGDSIAVLPATPVDADTVSIELDLTEGKLASLQEAGGDMSVVISALLTMHRKLDESFDSPEIPLINEWQVWGQKTGTLLRMTTAYVDAGGTATPNVVVALDGRVGDIPLPLSGRIRVIDADDGVNSAAWGSAAVASAYVSYTRSKRSGDLVVGTGALGDNYGVGCLVEVDPAVGGLVTNSGLAPEADNKHLAGLIWQLVNSVNAFAILGV